MNASNIQRLYFEKKIDEQKAMRWLRLLPIMEADAYKLLHPTM